MNNCEEVIDIAKFYLCWEKSISAKLLVPNPHGTQLHLGKNKGELASIAYLACLRNTIHLIDDLFEKWEIMEKATVEFKGKLKENWMEKKEERYRNISNDTISSIVELSVATYLDDEGYSIKNINAWGDKKADITCEKDNKKYYFEVKYFPDSPEFYNLRVDAAKRNGVSFSSVSNQRENLNYLYYRLGEAITQLNKQISNEKNKTVFFVFAETATQTGRIIFEENIENINEWYHREDGSLPGLPPNYYEKIIDKSPRQWLSSISGLFIGTMKNWRIENITSHWR